jgi:hypothetical protein
MGHEDDPDREAILARRRKLVAVALSGLTTLGACGGDPAPAPCLEPPIEVRESQGESAGDETRTNQNEPEEQPLVREPIPGPCLAPPPHRVEPEPEDEDDEPREARPRPCLSERPRPEP